MTKTKQNEQPKKKGLISRWLEKLDQKLAEQSQKSSCCGGPNNKKGSSCC